MAVVRLPSGIEIFHRVTGRGEPLLLIMGTGADHTFWGGQVPAYRKRFLTITYDARGTGRSSKPADVETYSMEAMAEDAIGLLDALEIPAAHVSGFSLGSAVAQEMAIRRPEMVTTLQLHGTWGRSDRRFRRMLWILESLAMPESDGEFASRAVFSTFVSSAAKADPPPGVTNPYPPTREGILGHIHANRAHDTLDRLARISCPTLVTAAENDVQIPPHYAQAVAERIPGADLHLFGGPDAGHLVCFDMKDEFNRVTLEWLARRSGVQTFPCHPGGPDR
jgi:pimeloyl-ACP methyl ester carboxylesterase